MTDLMKFKFQLPKIIVFSLCVSNIRGQRSSEALLNVAAECYMEGVSAREVSKIFSLFGVETITSTQELNTSKSWMKGLNLGELETLERSLIWFLMPDTRNCM